MLGSNQFGQLGLSSSQSHCSGSCYRVAWLEGHFVTKVACGDSFTVAITNRTSLSATIFADRISEGGNAIASVCLSVRGCPAIHLFPLCLWN